MFFPLFLHFVLPPCLLCFSALVFASLMFHFSLLMFHVNLILQSIFFRSLLKQIKYNQRYEYSHTSIIPHKVLLVELFSQPCGITDWAAKPRTAVRTGRPDTWKNSWQQAHASCKLPQETNKNQALCTWRAPTSPIDHAQNAQRGAPGNP